MHVSHLYYTWHFSLFFKKSSRITYIYVLFIVFTKSLQYCASARNKRLYHLASYNFCQRSVKFVRSLDYPQKLGKTVLSATYWQRTAVIAKAKIIDSIYIMVVRMSNMNNIEFSIYADEIPGNRCTMISFFDSCSRILRLP